MNNESIPMPITPTIIANGNGQWEMVPIREIFGPERIQCPDRVLEKPGVAHYDLH